MDTRQINKLTMFLAVRRYCDKDENQTALKAIEVFHEQYQEFLGILPSIRHQARLSMRLITGGVTESKEAVREGLAASSAKISAALSTYAEVTENLELLQGAKLTRSAVLYGRELEVADSVDNLLKLALQHAPQLERYGLSKERLDDYDDLSQQFSEAIGRPRAIIRERKMANETLIELFSTADKRLDRMDRLALILDETHPDFVAGYRESRRTIHTPATRSEIGDATGVPAETLVVAEETEILSHPHTNGRPTAADLNATQTEPDANEDDLASSTQLGA